MLRGDCLAVLADMEPESVDSIVTDPPYEIGFMGRAWDATGIAYDPATWAACLRVLKPGGHLLSFGATRTYHGIASAIERAGFEIRDCLSWLYGSGFPKSLDVSKAIDKAAGAEREPDEHDTDEGEFDNLAYGGGPGRTITRRGAPATADAERWQGWGTALKPAWEPVVLARKPLGGTVAANVLRYGTGALNVDGCRLSARGEAQEQGAESRDGSTVFGAEHRDAGKVYAADLGRWPANVTLDAEAAAMLDEQSGTLTSSSGSPFTRHADGDGRSSFGTFDGNEAAGFYGDTGGASRFFYVAKPSTAERSAGLDGFKEQVADPYGQHRGRRMEDNDVRFDGKPAKVGRNVHPTVKPIELMRWLCRLVTPPRGVVLDPFTGSGTTGCAAVLEGLDFIGCELGDEYADIAEARIAWWAQHAGEGTAHELLDAGRERDATTETGQASIFDMLDGTAA